jgi:branched-chain amino acid transport system permease protein
MEILPQLIINSLISGSMYALVSASLALTFGLLRILNFAHGQFLMLGAYLFYLFLEKLEMNFWLSILACLGTTIVIASITLKIFITPYLQYSYMLPMLTTLALATILESLVAIFLGVDVKSFSSLTTTNPIEFYSITITPIQIFIIVSSLVILSLLAIVVHLTSLGRKIRAASESQYACQALGINYTKLSYLVFTVSTILSVFAGVTIALETNLQPTMGATYTIKAFAAMVLGGLGNVWGTVIGAYCLGFIENICIGLDFGQYSLPAGYKDSFAFMIILLILLFKPQGIFNQKLRTT